MKSGSATEIYSDVYSDEWQKDFREKENTLNCFYEPITPAEYYQRIFGSKECSCNLLLKESGKFKTARNFVEAEKYLADNSEVCLYLQTFYNNIKPTYQYIQKCYGFVVELDNVRSKNMIDLKLKMFDIKFKPNILVSSGNGIHLYYLFSEPFEFYSYTYVISALNFSRYNPTTRRSVMNSVMQVYGKLCDLYEDDSIGYKVDRMHLSQPIRMCGSTTKNVNIRTAGYHVTNERMSLEDYAEIFGVELIDNELAQSLNNYINNEPDSVVTDQERKNIKLFGDIDTDFYSYYKQNRSKVISCWMEYTKKLCEEDQDQSPATPIRHKTQVSKKTCYSNYLNMLFIVKNKTKKGSRQKALHIFCSRAAMYHVPEQRVKDDARALMNHFNEKSPDDIITEKELECALQGYYKRYRYKNETIERLTGLNLNFENKREVERSDKRAKKSQMKSDIQQGAIEFIQAHRNCSYRDIFDYLELNGYEVSLSTILRDEVIKSAKLIANHG